MEPSYGNVKEANSNILTPKQQGTTKLAPQLSKTAQHSFIFDDLVTGSLISIGQLCDDNCIALFSKHNVNIVKITPLSSKTNTLVTAYGIPTYLTRK